MKEFNSVGICNAFGDNSEALNNFYELLQEVYDETEDAIVGLGQSWQVNGIGKFESAGAGINLRPGGEAKGGFPIPEVNPNYWNFEVATDLVGPVAKIHYNPQKSVNVNLQLLENGFFYGASVALWGLEGDTRWGGDIDLEFRRTSDNKSRKIKYKIFAENKHYTGLEPGSVSLILCPSLTEGTSLPFIGIRKLLGNLPLRSIVKFAKAKTAVKNVLASIDPSNRVWNGKTQDEVADNVAYGIAGVDFAILSFKAALTSGALNINI